MNMDQRDASVRVSSSGGGKTTRVDVAGKRRAIQEALERAGTVDLGFTVKDLLRFRDESKRKIREPAK
jgi:hypothetical protein